jgi:pyruvate formate lyase activating enzyme
MSTPAEVPQTPLEAGSPFELRVGLSKDVPETTVRQALASGDMGFVHSFTTGSAVDGPGVRVVAWTAGCMWRCVYCHNPDTWSMRNGIPVSIATATAELAKYRNGLKVMHGGLTISGGEPLMQHKFVTRLLAAARAMGVHTALDTNGYLGDRLSDDELASIDLVLLDIKAWEPARHVEYVGMEIGPKLAFARRLAALRRPIWIRHVVVPGWTDDEATPRGIAEFAASLGNVERVDVLPFHQMGRYKWSNLHMPYRLEHVESPSTEVVQRSIDAFRTAGLHAF